MTDPQKLTIIITSIIFILATIAEWIHYYRCKRLSHLAFGPSGKPRNWTIIAPILRPICLATITWSLWTLFTLKPAQHSSQQEKLRDEEYRHMVIILDVSPSMWLKDAGNSGKLKRSQRTQEVITSLMDRICLEQVKISVVAVYTGAKRIVEDSKDPEVIKNILNDLPLTDAFENGKTDLISGFKEAATLAAKWPKQSTTIVLISDGDTVPDSGMPEMPPSIANVMVIGVGNTNAGIFIDGHQSRQDTTTLRQIARRLNGTYHNANRLHIPSSTIDKLSTAMNIKHKKELGEREIALIALGISATIFSLLPILLELFGCHWNKRMKQINNKRKGILA